MKSFEHVYRLHRLLKRQRYPVPFERIQEELAQAIVVQEGFQAAIHFVPG